VITKFTQFNEGIKNLLVGPTEDEVWDKLKGLSPDDLLDKSSVSDFLPGVKKAVELGADIHVQNDIFLRDAASRGYIDIIEYIISIGVEIDILHQEALRFASMNNHFDIVKLLLEHGSKVDSIGGKIALRVAKEKGFTRTYRLLKEYYNEERSKKKWWKK